MLIAPCRLSHKSWEKPPGTPSAPCLGAQHPPPCLFVSVTSSPRWRAARRSNAVMDGAATALKGDPSWQSLTSLCWEPAAPLCRVLPHPEPLHPLLPTPSTYPPGKASGAGGLAEPRSSYPPANVPRSPRILAEIKPLRNPTAPNPPIAQK